MVDDAAAAYARRRLTSPEAAGPGPAPPSGSGWWPAKASPARPGAPSPGWRPWGGGGGGVEDRPSAPWSTASSPRRAGTTAAGRWGGGGPGSPPANHHPPPAFDPASDLASHVAALLASIASTVRTARSAALLLGSAAGGAACLAGWALLLALLAARALAPPADVVTRDLWVDYTASPASGVASFLPDPAAAALVAAAAQEGPTKGNAATTLPRAFPAGRRLDVWLAMEAPDVDARGGGGGAAGDVFQVRAELLAPDGRVLAAASRPALLPPRSRAARALRSAALAPLVVLGLADELRTLRVPLFSGYRDRPDAPFVALRIALAGRVPAGTSPAAGPGPPPALAAVRGVVSHRLGLARRLLYYVRPGDALAWPLFALAAAAIAGGGAAAALCGLGWALTAGRRGGGGVGGGGGDRDEHGGGRPWDGPPSATPFGAATPSVAGTEDGRGEDDASWEERTEREWGGLAGPGREPSVIISSSDEEEEGGFGAAAGSASISSGSEEFVDSVPGTPEEGGGLRWRGGGGGGGGGG